MTVSIFSTFPEILLDSRMDVLEVKLDLAHQHVKESNYLILMSGIEDALFIKHTSENRIRELIHQITLPIGDFLIYKPDDKEFVVLPENESITDNFLREVIEKDDFFLSPQLTTSGDSGQIIYLFRYFEPWKMIIGIAVTSDELHEPINRIYMIFSLTVLGFVFLSILLILLTSKSISKPLVELVETVTELGEGEFHRRTISKGKDEIAVLSNSFNTMAESIARSTNELKSLRNYLYNIINSMPSILIGVDSHCNISLWNKAAEDLTGISEENTHGEPLDAVYPVTSLNKNMITNSIERHEIIKEHKKSRQDGNRTYYEDITIYPLVANGIQGAVIRIDDVTEKVLMEKMMVQSEKMLSVGGLAAGMAHEVNNPLAGIIQTANVLAKRLWQDVNIPSNQRAAEEIGLDLSLMKIFMEKRDIPRMLDAMIESGKRVSDIVNNMLSFTRKSEDRKTSQNLIDLIDKTIEIAGTDYDLKKQQDFRNIEIVKEYDHNIPLISCDVVKIQQVVLNLVRNSAQAMQSADVQFPRITVRLKIPTEQEVLIEIEDNGPGMSEEIRSRVFEPFFTTKEEGVGMGLGLSVSYFIITENHQGTLSVESTPGKGTKFIIGLPVK
ncbi:MAG: HAMP domain-containing protein [Spirochaetaceae bacterium]|nr:HAMP domain-containing protein [Spirochaetaceae bacterium]